IKHFFALAPALSSLHLGSSFIWDAAEQAAAEENPFARSYNTILGNICAEPVLNQLCYSSFREYSGPITQVEESQLQLVTSHFPGGTSNKNIKHWMQQMIIGTKYFDYGSEGNLEAYGSMYPREYNFSVYSVPTSLYFSMDDKLVNSEDMKIALTRLPTSAIVKSRNLTGFGHFEFVWGSRAKAEIYDGIIADMNKMDN
ncbi:hypothetical protein PMAYCL1PPCAC_09628, partial [Pristionchus mayeri]